MHVPPVGHVEADGTEPAAFGPNLFGDDFTGNQVQYSRPGIVRGDQSQLTGSLSEGLESVEHSVVALVSVNPLGFSETAVSAKYVDERLFPCSRCSALRRGLDKVFVSRRRPRGDLEVGLNHNLADDKALVVMLLGPIAPLHLPSLKPLDLGLGVGNSPERPKIGVFVAPGVDTVHMIGDVSTHQRCTPRCKLRVFPIRSVPSVEVRIFTAW